MLTVLAVVGAASAPSGPAQFYLSQNAFAQSPHLVATLVEESLPTFSAAISRFMRTRCEADAQTPLVDSNPCLGSIAYDCGGLSFEILHARDAAVEFTDFGVRVRVDEVSAGARAPLADVLVGRACPSHPCVTNTTDETVSLDARGRAKRHLCPTAPCDVGCRRITCGGDDAFTARITFALDLDLRWAGVPRYGRDTTEMRPRYDRDAAEIRPRYDRYTTEMRPGRGKHTAEMWPSCCANGVTQAAAAAVSRWYDRTRLTRGRWPRSRRYATTTRPSHVIIGGRHVSRHRPATCQVRVDTTTATCDHRVRAALDELRSACHVDGDNPHLAAITARLVGDASGEGGALQRREPTPGHVAHDPPSESLDAPPLLGPRSIEIAISHVAGAALEAALNSEYCSPLGEYAALHGSSVCYAPRDVHCASDGIVITADVSLKLLLGGDSSARVYRDPNLRAMQAEWASQPLHSVMIIVITT